MRQFLLTLWNTYSFYVTYANIDGFDPDAHTEYWKDGRVGEPTLAAPPPNELDRWIISELNGLVAQVADDMDAINPTGAGRRIQEFVNLLSNWYVRPEPPTLLEGRERRRQDVGVRDALLMPAHAHETHRADDPVVADAMFRNLAPADPLSLQGRAPSEEELGRLIPSPYKGRGLG